MKKLLVLLFTIFALNGCEEDTTIIDATADKKLPKVDVCHYDDATGTWETININENALKAHLAHGDTQGDRCGYTYVPDDAFEQHLKNKGYDDVLDDYVLTSNISDVETLNLGEFVQCTPEDCGDGFGQVYVQSLEGLQDFKSLKSLIFYETYTLREIDLTPLTKLEFLLMHGLFGMNELDLSQNIMLKEIVFMSMPIESLDLSNNSLLNKVLIESCSNLTSLDLSGAKALESLHCYSNRQLTSLDVSGAKALITLGVLFNQLTELDVSQNTALESLSVKDNQLTCIQKGDNPLLYLSEVDTHGVPIMPDCGY